MKMTKENILTHLEKLGKEIAEKAKTQYWSLEDHTKAKRYEKTLQAMRAGYKMVADGKIIEGLEFLKNNIDGIEGNKIRLLLTGNTTGFDKTSSWAIINGDLVFKNK